MCGICCIFHSSRATVVQDEVDQEYIRKRSRLGNRGPDAGNFCSVSLIDGKQISLSGYVLHLRGDELVKQPAQYKNGDILLWNAEIFGGIKVEESECDTQVVLELLARCSNDADLLTTLGQIQGPWSFLYWQSSSESLWFGRDVFGRRSLLWHLPESQSDVLALSSVQILPWEFQEVPSVGIYRLRCNKEFNRYRLTLFPWQHAVWPGTLDPVAKDNVNRLYNGGVPPSIDVSLSEDMTVVSQMPPLNKIIPTSDTTLPLLAESTHLQYLKTLANENAFLRAIADQLTSLLHMAVKTRVENQRRTLPCPRVTYRPLTDTSDCIDSEKLDKAINGMSIEDKTTSWNSDQTADGATGGEELRRATGSLCHQSTKEQEASKSHDDHMISDARVAILFSGGIDSAVIAALADRVVPAGEQIDLINVAFEQKPKQHGSGNKHRFKDVPLFDKWEVPDRKTGHIALGELNSGRRWNFIEVNVTIDELQEARQEHIRHLVYPLNSVLDDSIGCAVWFAARGRGILGNGPDRGKPIISTSRVILCGMGADEQLIGYSRHRGRFQEEGWEGLLNEIELEITRISARNLGRDDRIITDHGKESRFPFLDERVVQFLSSLPIDNKADLTLPRGLGEKLLLRLAAIQLELHETATQPKRAIQFGSRIAKIENSKEKASDTCTRLN